jgi:hypothetical protein
LPESTLLAEALLPEAALLAESALLLPESAGLLAEAAGLPEATATTEPTEEPCKATQAAGSATAKLT